MGWLLALFVAALGVGWAIFLLVRADLAGRRQRHDLVTFVDELRRFSAPMGEHDDTE